MADLLEQLNPAQKEAVTHTEGPLLIVAGAGSGKTRVLTHRIAYIIESKMAEPEQILAVTFTNKAAKEMKDRIARLLGAKTRQPLVGTFHAISVRFLRRYAGLLGYPNSFVIYDTADQLSLMKTIIKERGLSEKQFHPQAVLHQISNAKNELINQAQYQKLASGFFQETAAELYVLYQDRLKAASAMDFDDLIVNTVGLFEQHPEVLATLQEQFKYLLVDEYQDTNHAQYRWISLLADKRHNLAVVGDPDQGIYSWRGATIRNIMEFEAQNPGAVVINLEQNYRSTPQILGAADAVIENNSQRKPKKLFTENKAGERIMVVEHASADEEARYIVTEAERLATGGGSLRDSAVLYRTNAQSRTLEEMCLRYQIPYQIVGGIRFYERKEIKDTLAYLRLIATPGDEVAFVRVINVPPRGIGDRSLEILREFAGRNSMTLLKAAGQGSVVPGLPPKAAAAFSEFAQMVEKLRSSAQKASVSELIEDTLKLSGYKSFLVDGTPEGDSRFENVQELRSVAESFPAPGTGGSVLDQFLEEIALVADVDNYSESQEALTMMTLHSAKGLEFDNVFIAGLEEGIFPHANSSLDAQELEEERRLCYVGMTRARKRLYLNYAQVRLLFGSFQQNTPSRFLSEIPEEFTEEAGLYGARSGTRIKAPAREEEPFESSRPSVELEEGDVIEHDKFGKGTVTEVRGDEIAVHFPKIGYKKLSTTFAPISKISE